MKPPRKLLVSGALAGAALAGGALIASGRHLISEAGRGRLGPEFQLDVAPIGYSGGGGLSMQGTF